MFLCWHKWKKISVRIGIKNVVECCGTVVSIDHATVVLKECQKCRKAKAWEVFDGGMRKRVDVGWAEHMIRRTSELQKGVIDSD